MNEFSQSIIYQEIIAIQDYCTEGNKVKDYFVLNILFTVAIQYRSMSSIPCVQTFKQYVPET